MARRKNPMSPTPLPPVTDPATPEETSYLQFLEGMGQRVEIVDPLSDEGLRLQALYIQNFSQHPLDAVKRIMENPFSDPKDRLSAAKILMEYSMRKPTTSIDLKAKGAVIAIDPSTLSALSAAELETLEKLLEKVA